MELVIILYNAKVHVFIQVQVKGARYQTNGISQATNNNTFSGYYLTPWAPSPPTYTMGLIPSHLHHGPCPLPLTPWAPSPPTYTMGPGSSHLHHGPCPLPLTHGPRPLPLTPWAPSPPTYTMGPVPSHLHHGPRPLPLTSRCSWVLIMG